MDRPGLTLLMTRPVADATRFVATLAPDVRAAVAVCTSPLIGISPVSGKIEPGDARGLIFSSANGVQAARDPIPGRDLTCFCVGATTAQQARDAGWTVAVVSETADDLVAALLADPPALPLLHLRGRHARGEIAARLTRAGCATAEQVIYDQPIRPLSDAARRCLDGDAPVLVPLFSPRTARAFAEQMHGRAPITVVAISDSVAAEVADLPLFGLVTAKQPTGHAMRIAIESVVRDHSSLEGPRVTD
jgi:uroporphyrinogen-III synthase